MLPRVLELISCLVAKDPGLGGGFGKGKKKKESGSHRPCRLSLELLGERGAAEARAAALDGGGTPHHVGPLATLTADPQSHDPLAKRPYPRFLWEFLARATREEEKEGGEAQRPCERGGGGESGGGGERRRCPAGSVCARSPSSSSSTSPLSCVRASVAFVAAYPLNLECRGCDGAENYGNWKALDSASSSQQGGGGDDDKNQTRRGGQQQQQPPPPPLLPAAAAADAWRRSLGWPEEPLWAESDWDEGIPRLSLWRASSSTSGGGSGFSGLGLSLLWAAAAAASAGALLVAAAARRELERTGWENSSSGFGYEEAGGNGDDDQGFVPSF